MYDEGTEVTDTWSQVAGTFRHVAKHLPSVCAVLQPASDQACSLQRRYSRHMSRKLNEETRRTNTATDGLGG